MKSKWQLFIKLICVTLCLVFSLGILWIFLPFANNSLDAEYAVLTADDEIVTKNYPIGYCTSLWFFHASISTGNKRTEFIHTTPDITIVNDDNYYVEITTNKSIHDVLSVSASCGILDVDLQDSCYNRVYEDDIDYDYDYGLYVDCSQFDMVVHAPIRTFQTSTQTILDFDVAKAPDTFIHFSNGGTQAKIYNIDTNNLTLYCSDSSEIAISGTVKDSTTMMVWHSTKVDADELNANRTDFFVSNRPFGISYIKYNGKYVFEPFDLGSILSFFLLASPAFWLCLVIKNIRKLINLTKHSTTHQGQES